MSNKNNTPSAPATELTGNIGTFQLVMTVFALSAPLMTVAGICPLILSYGANAAVMIYLMVTLILLIFSIGFVKMSEHMQNPGGFYAFATAGLGKKTGLGVACLASIGYPMIGFIGSCYFPLTLVHYIEAAGGPDLPWWPFSLLYLALIGFLDSRKVEFSVRILAVVMVLECIVVIVFDIMSFVRAGTVPGGAALAFPAFGDPDAQVGASMIYIFGTFLGFESTVIYREEVREPNKTIPRATLLAVVIIGVFYAVATWAFVGFYGADNVQSVAQNDIVSLFENSMVILFGRIALDVISIMVMFSMFASTLSVVNASARYWYSLGKDGAYPKFFAKVHPKHASPYAAVWTVIGVYMVLVIALVITGLDPEWFYPILNGVGAFALMCVFFVVTLAVVNYFRVNRNKEGSVINKAICPALAVIGIGLCIVLSLMHFEAILSGGLGVEIAVIAIIVAIFIFGIVYANWLQKNKPEVYSRLGREPQ